MNSPKELTYIIGDLFSYLYKSAETLLNNNVVTKNGFIEVIVFNLAFTNNYLRKHFQLLALYENEILIPGKALLLEFNIVDSLEQSDDFFSDRLKLYKDYLYWVDDEEKLSALNYYLLVNSPLIDNVEDEFHEFWSRKSNAYDKQISQVDEVFGSYIRVLETGIDKWVKSNFPDIYNLKG